jgi:predicted deacylase
MQPFELGTASARPGERAMGELLVAQAGDAAPARIPLIVVRGLTDGPVLCVCGGIHGNEYAGIEAVTRFARELDPRGLTGTLVAVPLVHYASFESEEPTSPHDQLNLNRAFPGAPDGSATQRLAHAFLNEIVLKCSALVDLHTGGKARIMPMVIAQRGFEPLAWDLALASGFDLIWRGGSWGGTGRISALQAGIPAITVEAGGGMDCSEADVAAHLGGIANVMRYLGMLPGEPQRAARWRVVEADSTYAGAEGFFVPLCAVGDSVRSGQLFARIRDAHGNTIEELRAPKDGLVTLLRVVPHVRAGDEVCILGEVVRTGGSDAPA